MTVRTLYEIVDGAKDGNRPTHEECYYAMLVLAGLLNMASKDISDMAHGNHKWDEMTAEEAFQRNKAAYDADVRAYLGDNVPGNPQYDQFRAWGQSIIDKVLKEQQP